MLVSGVCISVRELNQSSEAGCLVGDVPGEKSPSGPPGPAAEGPPGRYGSGRASDGALGDGHISLSPLLQPLREPADGLLCRRPRTVTMNPFSGTDREPQKLTLIRNRNIAAVLSARPLPAPGAHTAHRFLWVGKKQT